MTIELLMKGFFAMIYSILMAWVVVDRDPVGSVDSSRQRYLPYIPGNLLPICMLTFMVALLAFAGIGTAARMTLAYCFGVFLHIGLYDFLLMPALPVLRRHISARACAMLWMLPNYLYLTQMSSMRLPAPRWVVQAPAALVRALLWVWLAGFLAVLGWKIISHLVFRAHILREAAPVTDPAVLAVWRQEVEAARFKKSKFQLVTSPAVVTPLSVGLFARAVRVVLPRREYTGGELALLFRHELVHIGREDAWSKFFLVFCTAMCWFNPLMWLAVRKSSEDLELSCDETVLLDCGGGVKRQYANLLLKTAGDERGFTTCLSASAGALRYRLKSVVESKEKHSGALAVGLVFFLLCMSCGYVTLAYGEDTGAEQIYQSRPPEQYTLDSAFWDGGSYDGGPADPAALHRYLSALPMEHIAGNYSFDDGGRSLTLMFNTPEGLLGVTLSDRFVEILPLSRGPSEYYYLPDGTDWDALRAYIFGGE